MAITKTTGYKASDGQVYATVEEAQRVELKAIIKPALYNNVNANDEQLDAVINTLFEHSEDVLAILTTGPRSRPNTRKKAGTTAPRRARARAATATEAANGFKAMREAVDAPQEPETALEAGR